MQVTALLWLPLAACTAWVLAGLAAVALLTRRVVAPSLQPPAVSVLKPLCGRDADLAANLESFFRQDHPELELLFGVVDASDPALDVVRELRRRYPRIDCRAVVHEGAGALNPKVNNLLGMLPHAKHDLVLVSDSNVHAPSHYVREAATLFARERPGLVTHLFAGTGDETLGAALENVQLCGFVAAGTALPTLLGDAILVGKSALFSRRSFERLGGLRRLSDVLAEDYVMGKTFGHAGQRVLVAPTVLQNVTANMSVRAMFARHLRWSMMRWRLSPLPSALEVITSPLALLPLAWLVMGPSGLVWTLGLLAVRDAGGWLLLRGVKNLHLPLLLAPLRDAVVLLAWAIAPFKQHVSWRGKRFRLGAGTLLYQEPESAPGGGDGTSGRHDSRAPHFTQA